MRHLTLADALELVILYAEKRDPKFERAACSVPVARPSRG